MASISTAGRGWPSCCASSTQIDGLDWIRLLYLYPMYFTDELIDVLSGRQ